MSHRGEKLFLSQAELSGRGGIKADRHLRSESARGGEERGKLFFDGGDGGGRARAFNDNQLSFGLKNCTEKGCVDDFFCGAAWQAALEGALESEGGDRADGASGGMGFCGKR